MGTMINRIVESMMTADEQVELMRLEDEVCDARDQLEFINDSDQDGYDPVEADILSDVAREDLNRCESNLNKYIARITKQILDPNSGWHIVGCDNRDCEGC